ncbi:hypothetical protein [Microbacterium aurantiacum]|uniref:hypothetical protein n=1 Tax=Microbacterium aurantiacum TaxID=162393 RepID=UPI00341AB9C6
MLRLLRLSSPASSSILLRLSQLLVMVVGSQVLPSDARASFLVAFSVVAAFGVFSDSGAGNFLLAQPVLSRTTFEKAVATQLWVAAAGAALGAVYSVVFLPWPSTASGLLIAGSLGASQALDSATRAARSGRLKSGDDWGFSLGDGVAALAKMLLATSGLLLDSITFVLGLPVASAIVFCFMYLYSRPSRSGANQRGQVRQIFKFGLAGVTSGLYSQAPFLLLSAIAPIQASAALSVLLRVVQPLEIVPAVASQQVLARASSRRVPVARLWLCFTALGALFGTILILLRAEISELFGSETLPLVLAITVALILPIKFGNYLLNTMMLAKSLLWTKISISIGVGLAATIATLLIAPIALATGTALVMLTSEVMLAASMAFFLLKEANRPGKSGIWKLSK